MSRVVCIPPHASRCSAGYTLRSMMTTRRRVFRVRFELDDDTGCWLVSVDGIEGQGHAQKLTRARERAGEMIVEAGLAAAGQFELDEDAVLPAAVRRALERERKARVKAEAATVAARGALDDALDTMTETLPTLGVRDMADLLGLSFGRIGQLRRGRPRRGRRPAPKSPAQR